MNKARLDQAMVSRGLVSTRSQAESYIKLGKVNVRGKTVTKPGYFVNSDEEIELDQDERYVSRAALKLASAVEALGLDFKDKTVLDVGSSTGGFTDYALQHGAKKVIAVDVGTNQMHASLRDDSRVELMERTDVRDIKQLSSAADIALIDVSFISLKQVLPAVANLMGTNVQIVAMCKPQFEANDRNLHKGVVKNDSLRRQILKDFEAWAKEHFIVSAKADSKIPGTKGNLERFYLLHKKS